MNSHELLIEAALNVLAHFDKPLSESEIKWISAKVKNTKVGTETMLGPSGDSSLKIIFTQNLIPDIGKTFEFKQHLDYPTVYGHYRPNYGMVWFHKSWLDFEKNGKQLNLFSQDN